MIGELGSEPWFPTLAWLINRKEAYDGTGPIDYTKYGWDALVVPDDCPNVSARMDQLAIRFNQRYMMRLLNQESLENWQIRLQNRFDEIVRPMERAYKIYADNAAAIDNVVPGTTKTTIGTSTDSGTDTRIGSGSNESAGSGSNTSTTGGSDTSTSEGKESDTPNSVINASANYAGSTSKQSGTVKYGRTEGTDFDQKSNGSYTNSDKTEYGKKTDITGTETTKWTGSDVLKQINESIDGYRDIDTMFVAGFENNFLNIFWY